MELHTLKPAAGAVKKVKRIARGEGSGHGGTATRGHKGDKARTGHKNKRNHEGGQMPLQMRLPKRGFKNINRVEYVAFNLDRLESLAEKHNVEMIDFDFLRYDDRSQSINQINHSSDIDNLLARSSQLNAK